MRNRLHALCPYFALFPETFALDHIDTYTAPGDYLFEPFAGRGTTVLQALLMGRRVAAMDINPVAYCISGAKAQVPSLDSVLNELKKLEAQYLEFAHSELEVERRALPPFFRRAFYHTTLCQILFLRRVLNWQHDRVHRFIAALVLGSLHGEMDKTNSYFSNQMPRTISLKPGYSLRYWRQHNLWPKKREVFRLLESRAHFRLSGELPEAIGLVVLRDAREARSAFPFLVGKVKAIVTSPPYFGVTNYEEDQWLRLWFLGHQPRPTYGQISTDDRHHQKERYWRFLTEVWAGAASLLQPNAVLVCRMGGKGMDEQEITSGLSLSVTSSFPNAQLLKPPKLTNLRNRQTEAFRPGSVGCMFEIDYVFRLPFSTSMLTEQRKKDPDMMGPS